MSNNIESKEVLEAKNINEIKERKGEKRRWLLMWWEDERSFRRIETLDK